MFNTIEKCEKFEKVAMVTIGILVFGLLAMCAIVSPAYADECVYPTCGIVVTVDYAKDIIIIEDFTGNQWVWEGAEDWAKGDIVAMIVGDCDTFSIYDDVILDIRYCGWVD